MTDLEVLYAALLEQWENQSEERVHWLDFSEVLPFSELGHFAEYFAQFTYERADLHQLPEGVSRTDYQQFVVQQFIEWYAYQIAGAQVYGADQKYGADATYAAQPAQEWSAQDHGIAQEWSAQEWPAQAAPYTNEDAGQPGEGTAPQEPPTDPETLRSVVEALEIYASDTEAPGDLTDAHLELLATHGVHVEADLGMPPEDD
ncbi:hypothetical protein ACIQVA_36385 [Streptomyces microflavus]|uniref:hypothetical protein n=1 Tax=Streptomyces microflavus TaxID=1919 RepID=UPI0037F63458